LGGFKVPDWLSFSVVKDILLSAVALYGATLSTFNYIQAARKDRRAVVVKAATVMPTYGNTLGDRFAKVEAINAGHRAVIISSLAFEVQEGQRLFSMGSGIPGMEDTRLPASLSDGESAHLFVSYKDIGDTLLSRGRTQKTKLTPICINSLGAVYKGEPWEVDPGEFLRM
jgi:hypothetical protein